MLESTNRRTRSDLVMLHGWGVNHCVWQPVVKHLNNCYELHTLDLPGYADPAELHGTLVNMADAVAHSVAGSAVWMGWSLGGLVAMQVALSRPDKVERLILVGTNAKFVADEDWPHGIAVADMDHFCADLSRDYAAGLTRFLLMQSGKANTSRRVARQLGASIADCGAPQVEVLHRSLEVLKSSDLRAHLPSLAVPTHVIQGRLDRLVPMAAGRYLADRIPNARFSLMDAGHAPFITHPHDFSALFHGQHQ